MHCNYGGTKTNLWATAEGVITMNSIKNFAENNPVLTVFVGIIAGFATFAGILFFLIANINTIVYAQGSQPDCRSQPTTLRYIDNDEGVRLSWRNDFNCPANQFNIYTFTGPDRVKQTIAATTKTTFLDKREYGDTHVTYLVRAVVNGVEHNGVSITYQRGPAPLPTTTPVSTLPTTAASSTDRSLVCFYSQNGEIHSVSGARECTLAEINHVLDK